MSFRKVKIGGHDISIEFVKGMEASDQAGMAQIDNKFIRILDSYPPSAKEELLSHEILHFLMEIPVSCNIISAEIAENVILAMQNYFWRFLNDNTDFFKSEGE